jgi:hypothetical protein
MSNRPITDYEQWLREQTESYELPAEADYGMSAHDSEAPSISSNEKSEKPNKNRETQASGSPYGYFVTLPSKHESSSELNYQKDTDSLSPGHQRANDRHLFALILVIIVLVYAVRSIIKRKGHKGIILGTDM